MKCSEAQQLVKPYIQRKLTDREMEAFLDHIEHCRDCYDELEIYFSIYETLESSGKGSEDQAYDFKNRLRADVEKQRRQLRRRKVSGIFQTGLLIFAAVILLLTAFTGIEMSRGGGIQETTLYRLIYGAAPAQRETERQSEESEQQSEETEQRPEATERQGAKE